MSKSSVMTKIGLCILLVMIADGLFYRQAIGWTAGLYTGLLLLVLAQLNPQLLKLTANKIIVFGIVTLIIALIEAPKLLTIGLVSLGIITLLILQKRKNLDCALLWLKDIAAFLSNGFRQWIRDFHQIKRLSKGRTITKFQFSYAIIPISLTLLFALLFAQANPVIAQTLAAIDWALPIRLLSVWRWLFWFITGVIVWALLRPRFLLSTTTVSTGINLDKWLNQQTLVLSLMLFNGLFALQNVLDILFLWSGETLPNGLTYAEYAHGGAYPLFITSIITAIYVLLTFNEQQPHYQTVTAKKWVFVWLGQTVFLLLSAINRLLHYIEVYSLTYLRIIALIGMVLTAIGLLLIFTRIYKNYRNRWLINSNVLAVAITLYTACFINLDSIIADYNVRHTVEVIGIGHTMDLPYLSGLGSDALPALRWFQAHAKYSPSKAAEAGMLITELENTLANDTKNWRAWTWRKQRHKTMKSAPAPAVPIGNSGWQF